MTLRPVILAAGQGTRMRSQCPKVLHPLGGKPLLAHIVETLTALGSIEPPIVIIGHEADRIRQQLAHLSVQWVEQAEQRGTGHAVSQALPYLSPNDRVLIVCGDTPLMTPETLQMLCDQTAPDALGILTAHVDNPTGFGRILRDQTQRMLGIVEEKDATPSQRALTEINTGTYLVPASLLQQWLPRITPKNAQNEYYLTDIIQLAAHDHHPIQSVQPLSIDDIFGINDRVQLAHAERIYQRRLIHHWMKNGVTFLDPTRVDIRGECSIGQDVVIDVNVILEGRVIIGDHCLIGPHSVLRDTVLSHHVEIKPHSVIEGAILGDHCRIGPFARIRPDTTIEQGAHIGNFVEIKKSHIGTQSKINHLTYIGDADIGQRTNIGAGTITCNYDGVHKHRTRIGEDVFVGSNSTLIAPLDIGEGAYIGAGSTLSRNAPPHQLTLCRAREQTTIKGWKKPQEKSAKEP